MQRLVLLIALITLIVTLVEYGTGIHGALAKVIAPENKGGRI